MAIQYEILSDGSILPLNDGRVSSLSDEVRQLADMSQKVDDYLRGQKGMICLVPCRAEHLWAHMPGWHFCNGDQYELASPVGTALDELPGSYKFDWDITVSGEYISIPNMFYSDGRGYYLRPGNGTPAQVIGGSMSDQMRPITGLFGNVDCVSASGAFAYQEVQYGVGIAINNDRNIARISMDSARLGYAHAGTETHPLERYMTPAIFLGV